MKYCIIQVRPKDQSWDWRDFEYTEKPTKRDIQEIENRVKWWNELNPHDQEYRIIHTDIRNN